MTIIIVQCASRKQADAGYLHDDAGNAVHFVANPAAAPNDGNRYAHPDDLISNTKATFRDLLLAYNQSPGTNPWKLVPAGQLYDVPVYGELLRKVGPTKLYILSAGWGLIKSDFLTPAYDITFSKQADDWKIRRRRDQYEDFSQLASNSTEDIVAFCTPAYHDLLEKLCRKMQVNKVLFRRAGDIRPIGDWQYYEYKTTTRTNWHYECIKNFLA